MQKSLMLKSFCVLFLGLAIGVSGYAKISNNKLKAISLEFTGSTSEKLNGTGVHLLFGNKGIYVNGMLETRDKYVKGLINLGVSYMFFDFISVYGGIGYFQHTSNARLDSRIEYHSTKSGSTTAVVVNEYDDVDKKKLNVNYGVSIWMNEWISATANFQSNLVGLNIGMGFGKKF